MPPSDQDSLDRNKFDGFYKVKAREFWGENEIHHMPNTPPPVCEHEFISTKGGIICKKCNFALGLLSDNEETIQEALNYVIRYNRSMLEVI
jgi:hypothetical protein